MRSAAVIRRCRRLVVAGCVSLVPVVWACAQSTASGAITAAPAAACPTAQLTVVLRFGPGSGSAGHETGALLFRNHSSAPCTLRGYPGVSFVDAHGNQVGLPVDRATGHVRTVTVASGGTVGAQITLVDVGVFDPAVCRPTRVSGVRVFPPGHVRALFSRHTLTECRRPIHEGSVGPVVPRSQLFPGTF